MKNIVLYLIAGCLIIFVESSGQKPTIELLPTSHQRIHPEAVIDTSHSKDSLNKIVPRENSTVALSGEPENKSVIKRESRRKWFQRDSVFQKKVLKSKQESNWSERFYLMFIDMNPFKLFIHITALNI